MQYLKIHKAKVKEHKPVNIEEVKVNVDLILSSTIGFVIFCVVVTLINVIVR